MEDDMHTLLMTFLLCLLMSPAGVFGQTIQLPAKTLRLNVHREQPCSTSASSAERQQPSTERSWRGRHPVLFGALVGLGSGLAIEAAVIPGASGGEPHGVYMPMFGGVGAGIGALTGLIVSAARK
jgi:hypothetical protein